MSFKRIITHNDFDGVASAAICSQALGVNYLIFTGPRAILDNKLSVTQQDVVCDLPCPMEVGLWFDHHEGNLEELQTRQIDTENIPGKFETRDSCASVVYEYFRSDHDFPEHFEQLVRETDIIDSFNYASIDEWRQETPAHIIDATIRIQEESAERKWQYLRQLVAHMKKFPLEHITKMPSVKKRYHQYRQEEDRMLELLKDDITFLPQDEAHDLIIIDLTRHNHRPRIVKNLAYLFHPEAKAVIEVKNVFEHQTKTNDLVFAMSLSLHYNQQLHAKHIGNIMRDLNIGGGHAGAGAGIVPCETKEEMLKTKTTILEEIYERFQNQT